MRHLPLILVLAVTALVFGQVVTHDFLSWDDDVFLYQNPHTQPPTLESLKSYWTAPYAHLYAPVTYTAWWTLARAFGQPRQGGAWVVAPPVYHAASLLTHLLVVALAYLLLLRLVGSPWAAGVGAMLFAIHPLQVESVAWASELKDLLSGLFGLLAVLLYVRARQQQRLAPYLLATLAFIFAILSKPNLVTLPLLALVIDWLLLKAPARRALVGVLPWLIIAAAHTLLTRLVQPPSPALLLPLWQRLFVAGDSLAFYLQKLVLPVRLTADYGRMPALVVSHWWGYVTWLVPAGVLALAIITRLRSRWVLPGFLWFSLALLPVLGLMPFDFQQYSTVADHYAYLALFGPALALAGLSLHLKTFYARLPVVLLLVLLLAQSGLQTISWTNNLTFWQYTLQANPQSFLAHNNLGATYQMRGQLPQAAEQFEQALRLQPDDPDTTVNLGLLKAQLGDEARAKELLEKGLQLRPGDPKALLMLGIMGVREKDYDSAISHLQMLLEIEPQNVTARYQLALALLQQGRKQEARTQLEEVLRQEPGFTAAAEALKHAK